MKVTKLQKLIVEQAIKAEIFGQLKDKDTIDSDPIIARLRKMITYIPDHGTPASLSQNARNGRSIRLVGEDSGLIEKIGSVSKKIDGSKTTVTRYKVKR